MAKFNCWLLDRIDPGKVVSNHVYTIDDHNVVFAAQSFLDRIKE